MKVHLTQEEINLLKAMIDLTENCWHNFISNELYERRIESREADKSLDSLNQKLDELE